jgi:exosortase A-associated hydrolase 1
MTYTEEAVLFNCVGDTLVGVLSKPHTPAETGVVVIVGGPQYRAGSHRQFVLLSRALAQAGYAVLRFDYRGMGDSEGEPRDFQTVSPDIGAAIDTLQKHLPLIRQVVLWGLCDGASAALLYCFKTHDSRVSGLCLLNPWVRSKASLARTQVKHYYTRRVMEKEFWRKLFSGQVALGALGALAENLKHSMATTAPSAAHQYAAFQTQMARAWTCPARPVLLVLSGRDLTAKEFLEYAKTNPDWSGALTRPWVQRFELQQANHTFASGAWREQIEAKLLDWLTQTQLPAQA